MTADREPTIEELCRPLSAKVMPRSAMYSLDHRALSDREALANQRRSSSEVMSIRKKNRAGRDGGKSQPAEGE